MSYYAVCLGYYCSGILCFLLYGLAPSIFERCSLVAHGKTVPIKARNSLVLVPKRLFSLFYFMGIIFAVASLALVRMREWLLLGHLIRRLVETCIWPYSPASKMHLLHAIVGLSFYPILIISFALSSDGPDLKGSSSVLLILFFLGASIWQLVTHRALYHLRSQHFGHSSLVRHSRLFRHILCPHYTAEIILYLCLAGMSSLHPLLLLACLFVSANLAISATNTRAWHMHNFPPSMGEKTPAALLPYCL